MPDEILTLPEVAQLLKVADKTVYTMSQKGQLPAFKVRGQWRFKRVDIDRWIEKQKAESRNDGARLLSTPHAALDSMRGPAANSVSGRKVCVY